MKTLPIVWQRLVSGGQTCPRCAGTGDEVERACQQLREQLQPLGIEPVLEIREIDSTEFKANRLYYQGMSRVGCMPCINAGKDEIRVIAVRRPGHVSRIADWEWRVSQCSKHGFSTFFHKVDNLTGSPASIFARSKIDQVVDWANTSRGGRQYDLLAGLVDATACSSAYGLCE
ncbi:DUF2703 domain-containing protein [Chitinivorax sp. PXF-14]|uniref:DUF2703 domain-containing protein n=1 Tax=Chitinivorax sp. PXF-14 TaxID=3230488 RepID=UPI003466026C